MYIPLRNSKRTPATSSARWNRPPRSSWAPPSTLVSKLENGRLRVDQGVIAGCAGGIYENITDAADILSGRSIGDGAFSLSVYPASQPVMMKLVENGSYAKLLAAGATLRTAFCGPCFGAGDVPANGGLSISHSTRNFPNREGSKPSGGQIARGGPDGRPFHRRHRRQRRLPDPRHGGRL